MNLKNWFILIASLVLGVFLAHGMLFGIIPDWLGLSFTGTLGDLGIVMILFLIVAPIVIFILILMIVMMKKSVKINNPDGHIVRKAFFMGILFFIIISLRIPINFYIKSILLIILTFIPLKLVITALPKYSVFSKSYKLAFIVSYILAIINFSRVLYALGLGVYVSLI